MENKCPNCGYEHGENDAFCAMCGTKLDIGEQNKNLDEELSNSKDKTLDNIKLFEDNDKEEKEKPKSIFKFKTNFFDNPMFNFVVVVVLVSSIMCFALYTIIKKQNAEKLQMRYENMIKNPAQIPELKEPKSFIDLKTSLKSSETFLSLYLKYSPDNIQKKEQIFISYLKEMDKLPHITNENLVLDDLDSCSNIKSSRIAQKCAKKFTAEFKNIGVTAYSEYNTIYLYPDYKFIYDKYSKHLSSQMTQYLKLKAKYSTPLRVGLDLKVKPKKIADKIYDFERLYSKITDIYIREEVLKTIYNDLRVFLFTPSIYATTTREMTPEFKKAYSYFISMRKKSQLRPIIMSYMDKKHSYSEENFKNDYPYQMFEESFDDNVENSSLGDIFVQLRKNIFTTGSQTAFTYVYNIASASWQKYEKSKTLAQGEYVFSAPDENNNISVYNNTFSVMQEFNVPKYSKLFITNGSLYAFNADRLTLSKFLYDGKNFTLQQLNVTDASTVFPGIQVIVIDSYQNYNIYVEKDNLKAGFIILSRYSHGFDGYTLSSVKNGFASHGLPNMFSIESYDDVELSYHHNSIRATETSENAPTYRITIHTKGYETKNDVVKYDEKTAAEEEEEGHNPNMMPKIIKDQETEQKADVDNLSAPPIQNLEPPED